MNNEPEPMKKEPEGLAWRVSFSILVGVGWLVFLILWLFFFATNYVWEQNVAIFLLSLLLLTGLLGVPWAFWALKKQTASEKEIWKIKGFRWRIWVSIILLIGVIVFLIYWFWELAEPFDIYQNLAIFLVVFLIAGGVIGAMWAPWSMKYHP